MNQIKKYHKNITTHNHLYINFVVPVYNDIQWQRDCQLPHQLSGHQMDRSSYHMLSL